MSSPIENSSNSQPKDILKELNAYKQLVQDVQYQLNSLQIQTTTMNEGTLNSLKQQQESFMESLKKRLMRLTTQQEDLEGNLRGLAQNLKHKITDIENRIASNEVQPVKDNQKIAASSQSIPQDQIEKQKAIENENIQQQTRENLSDEFQQRLESMEETMTLKFKQELDNQLTYVKEYYEEKLNAVQREANGQVSLLNNCLQEVEEQNSLQVNFLNERLQQIEEQNQTLKEEIDYIKSQPSHLQNGHLKAERSKPNQNKQQLSSNLTRSFSKSVYSEKEIIKLLQTTGQLGLLSINLSGFKQTPSDEEVTIRIDKQLDIRNLRIYSSAKDEIKWLKIVGNQKIVIEDSEFNGVGLQVELSSNLVLKNVNFENTNSTSLTLNKCQQIIINNVDINKSQECGCYLMDSVQTEIDSMRISGCKVYGMVASQSNFVIKQSLISNCECWAFYLFKNSVGKYADKDVSYDSNNIHIEEGSQWQMFEPLEG